MTQGREAGFKGRHDLTGLHGFTIAAIEFPGIRELLEAPGLPTKARSLSHGEDLRVLRRPQGGGDRRDFAVGKDERSTFISEVAQEGVLAADLRVAAPAGLDVRIRFAHRASGGAIGSGEPLIEERVRVRVLIFEHLCG